MAMSAVKFSIKLSPTNMGFVNSTKLKFSLDFQSFLELIYKSSCSALMNAVMKYLNFRSSGSKLESITCKFTKNCTPSPKIFQEFHYKCRTAILKNASWWLLLMTFLFWKYSWMAASQSQLQRYIYLEILSYTYFTFLTVVSC